MESLQNSEREKEFFQNLKDFLNYVSEGIDIYFLSDSREQTSVKSKKNDMQTTHKENQISIKKEDSFNNNEEIELKPFLNQIEEGYLSGFSEVKGTYLNSSEMQRQFPFNEAKKQKINRFENEIKSRINYGEICYPDRIDAYLGGVTETIENIIEEPEKTNGILNKTYEDFEELFFSENNKQYEAKLHKEILNEHKESLLNSLNGK